MGFTVPIDQWLRGPLRTWAEGLLLDPSVGRDGLLDKDKVTNAWTSFREGRRTGGLGLWAILMLRAWQARWAA
jgi:asparagine synthase (glutamine-hydrolysing)